MDQHSSHPHATAVAPAMILLDPIGEGTWRVLDYRDGNTGIDVLVGFVQAATGSYAVTRLTEPAEQHVCRSLVEVQELFAAHQHH